MNLAAFRERLLAMEDYLDLTAAESALILSGALERRLEADEAGVADAAVPVLGLSLLLSFAHSYQNVCVRLDDIPDLLGRMREQCISANYTSPRFRNAQDPAGERERALGEFDRFFEDVLGSDRELLRQALLDQKLEGILFSRRDQSPETGPEELGELRPPILGVPLAVRGTTVYYARLFSQETLIVSWIRRQCRRGNGDLSADALREAGAKLELLFGPAADVGGKPDMQRLAAAVSCISPFAVITGGPGTGKTTTVAKLLLLLLSANQSLKIRLAAPTGKAANRMKESIGSSLKGFREQPEKYFPKGLSRDDLKIFLDLEPLVPREAETVHKMLGKRISASYELPVEPLPWDVVILDEASMMDIGILCALMRSLKPECRLILLGDRDQLPSVEAGSLFGDLCRAFLTPRGGTSSSSADLPTPAAFLTPGGVGGTGAVFSPEAEDLLAQMGYDRQILQKEALKGNLSDAAVRLTESRRFNPDQGVGRLAAALQDHQKPLGETMERVGAGGKKDDAGDKKDGAGDKKDDRRDWSFFRDLWALTMNDCPEKALLLDTGSFGRGDLAQFLRSTRGYGLYLSAVSQAGEEGLDLSLPENHAGAEVLFQAFEHFRILCTNRETDFGVEAVNRILGKEVRSQTAPQARGGIRRQDPGGEFQWYPGLPVMITHNDYQLGLFNGDIGITLKTPGARDPGDLRVLFHMADGSFRYYPTSALTDFEPSFAMTVHKSQGSEAVHVLLITPQKDSQFITREILYTGVTRARKTVTLACPAGKDLEILDRQRKRSNVRCSCLEERLCLGGGRGE